MSSNDHIQIVRSINMPANAYGFIKMHHIFTKKFNLQKMAVEGHNTIL